MTKTKVKAHPRKGTKGVKKHSRSRPKKKKVDRFAGTPLAGVRHILDPKYSDRSEPKEVIWRGKEGIASMGKETSKDIFSGEIYKSWYVAYRKHGIDMTDPLSKRMGNEFKKSFKTKKQAKKYFKSLKETT